jgi:hypothetical protein
VAFVSAADTHKAVRNIRDSDREFRVGAPALDRSLFDTAGMMSILQLRHTNASPKCHRSRASQAATKASIP